MTLVTLLVRLALAIFLSFLLFLSGCSYLPWVGDEEDDLAFEEDFPFEDEEFVDETDGRGKRSRRASRERSIEDDFFAEDDSFSDSDVMDGDALEDEDPDGFASVDQKTDRSELKGDVESLQNQQETLISKVRELEEMISTLEPKIDAATERIEGSVASASDSTDFLEPEVEDLKAQVARLKEEISRIKMQKASSAKMVRAKTRRRRAKFKTPHEYDKALSAYRSRNYDESILLFQNLALGNPPNQLKDNIAFWIGSNYLALEMYDDAILQFETVLNKYPRGNKVHDSRYMLGVTYSKKGETSRAIEILEGALKRNPTPEVRGKILAQLNQIQ